MMIRLATGLALTLALAACDAPASAPSATESATPTAAATAAKGPAPAVVEAATKAIKAESGVIDLVHDDKAVVQWVIGMKPDGTLRYGRAEAFCLTLSESGVDLSRQAVRIVDYQRYIVDGDGRAASMGTVECANSRHIYP